MYFRNKPSKTGNILQLVESYRDEEGLPRQFILASFGDAPLPEALWTTVAQEVGDRLAGQPNLFSEDIDKETATWVDRIVLQIRREGKKRPRKEPTTARSSHQNSDSNETESLFPSERELYLDGVNLHKIEHSEDVPLGSVLVGWQAWQDLKMNDLLDSLGFNGAQRNAAAISVINRLCDPVSEHHLPLWYEKSGLADLMQHKLKNNADDHFYRVSDLLHKNSKKIEAHLRTTQQATLGFERTLLLYDLTNTHFEGACEDNEKALYGRNKQKRNDCPQVVIGMLFDNQGFELAHEVFKGNMNDSKSLILMMESLNACVKTDGTLAQLKPIVIMDAGIATKANLALLRKNGFRYLVNESRRNRALYREQFEKKENFSLLPLRHKDKEVRVCVEKAIIEPETILQVTGNEETHQTSEATSQALVELVPSDTEQEIETIEPAYEERRVFCYSEERAKKELSMISKAEERFLVALEKLKKRLVDGNLKKEAAFIKAVTRLQTQHKRVQRFYKIDPVIQDKKITDMAWKRLDTGREQADDLCGCYVLRTNAPELSDDEIWHVYMTLTKAEDGFRSLKSDLGLRPNRHQVTHRVDGHIFICILAYQLLCHQLYKLQKAKDHREWNTLKRILDTHTYATIHVPLKDGTLHCLRKSGLPDHQQKNIYKSLGINYRNLPSTHTVITAEERNKN